MNSEENFLPDNGKIDEYIERQAEALEIVEEDLDTAFKTQAQYFLRASKFANNAAKIANLAKLNLEAVVASQSVELRANAVQKGIKLTEGSLGELIAIDQVCRKEKEKLAFANYQAAQYQSVVRAWEHKRDCLIQFGSNVRAGVTSSISLNDEPARVVSKSKPKWTPHAEDSSADEDLVAYANRKSSSSNRHHRE